MIINIGCLHSGTRYMAELFTVYGYDVKHEKLGADGVSSCELASDNITPVGAPKDAWRAWEDPLALTIYGVRNPRHNLCSILTNSDERWDGYQALFDPEVGFVGSRFHQAVQLMLHWHELCLARSPALVIPVEDAPQRVAGLSLADGRRAPRPDRLPATNTHTKGRRIPWSDAEPLFAQLSPGQLKAWVALEDFHWSALTGVAP